MNFEIICQDKSERISIHATTHSANNQIEISAKTVALFLLSTCEKNEHLQCVAQGSITFAQSLRSAAETIPSSCVLEGPIAISEYTVEAPCCRLHADLSKASFEIEGKEVDFITAIKWASMARGTHFRKNTKSCLPENHDLGLVDTLLLALSEAAKQRPISWLSAACKFTKRLLERSMSISEDNLWLLSPHYALSTGKCWFDPIYDSCISIGKHAPTEFGPLIKLLIELADRDLEDLADTISNVDPRNSIGGSDINGSYHRTIQVVNIIERATRAIGQYAPSCLVSDPKVIATPAGTP